jgi:dihydroflavonol-4-reductase
VNPEAFTLAPGDRVVVTGATGFIGSAVTRRLLEREAKVTALVEPGAWLGNLEGLEVDQVVADVRDGSAVRDVMSGARFCFHLAARFGFWPRDPRPFYEVNVEGSRTVVAAAAEAGVERICYTSSVATLGLWRTGSGELASEESYANVVHLHGNYKRSKYVAEHEVLRLAAEGAPVVLVQPTMPHGPRDHRPTPSGKVVLDYLNGQLPGYVDTAMNVAHVDDLAEGHLLALARGRQGRSYICGGENLTMRELLAALAELTGLPGSARSFPSALPMAAARASELVEGTLLRREPRVALEAAQMAATKMVFTDARAREELGYASRPARAALYDSARWFVEHGYVREERARQIAWRSPQETQAT